MNKYLSLLVVLMATLFATNSFAFTPPDAPDRGWYVVDQTGRLNTLQINALNNKIKRISQATHNEFGIAFLQSLDGESIEDAAYHTFQKWGIGKHGLDNGVLIMVALKDHKSRIETGKGVGGEITDLQARQILDNTMRPKLRSGDFYGAFDAALNDLSGLMDSRANQKATPLPQPQVVINPAVPVDAPAVSQPAHASESDTGLLIVLVVLGVGLGGFILFLVIADRRRIQQEEEGRRQRSLAYARDREQYQARYGNQSFPQPQTPEPAPAPVSTDRGDSLADTLGTIAAVEAVDSIVESNETVTETVTKTHHKKPRYRKEEDSSSSSSSSSSDSSSSYDSGSSSSSSWDSGSSGGGFGGGDSGGGGASSGW